MESLLLFIFSILIAIIFSAFFSAAETAVTGVSRAKIHKLRTEGNKRAKTVSQLRENMDRTISTLLLGNNAANIFASALATSSAITLFGESGVVYATLFMTLIILIFAEVLPKTYAFEHSEKVALAIAPLLQFLVKVLYPVTVAVEWLVKKVLWIFRIKTQHGTSILSGTDALRGAIDLHHHEGLVVKRERDMLGSILDLADTEVSEIMIHRRNIYAVSMDQPLTDIVGQALDSIHSRIPLWKENQDNIIGVLHIKDLLRMIRSRKGEFTEEDILAVASKPWFIPETTPLSEQLHEFRKRRNHFALVIDEYGTLMGAVTLEDILEEIVGPIQDEHDLPHRGIKEEKDGSYRVDGSISLRDLNRQMDWQLPDEHATTVAGLIMYETKDIPEEGQVFTFHGLSWEVLRKIHNRIVTVRIRILDEEPSQE
jgi:Mg2+/Co2+ transporter CorB